MRPKPLAFVLTVLGAALAFGQAASEKDQVFKFIHTENVRDLQEIGVGIRVIADGQKVSVDNAQRSIAMHGTVVQIGLAEWLWKELDQSPAAPPNPDPVVHQYLLPEGSADRGETVVRVFYLPRTTVQDFQEAATLIRTIAEIRRVFTYNASRALVMRATAPQIELAEWLLGKVGGPTNPQSSASAKEFRLPYAPVKGIDEGVVRVFFLPHTATIQDFQEAATLVRTIAQIRRVFTYNRPRAVAVRGTEEQIALAEWLLPQLDRQASAEPDSAVREYRPSGTEDDVVRVSYLNHAGTTQRVQEIATEVRTTTGIPRIFSYNPARALALRGTISQITQADRLIKERDK